MLLTLTLLSGVSNAQNAGNIPEQDYGMLAWKKCM
jgi:hypothetical protein